MRILHVTYPYISTPPKGYGGSEKVASQIVEGLVKRGHEVHLLATGDSITKANLHYIYEKQLTLSKFSPHYNIRQHLFAKYLVKYLDIDIVHNHMGEFGYNIIQEDINIGNLYPLGERNITTMHNDYQVRKGTCVAISKNQGKRLGLDKVVYNAIEPEKYIYSDQKEDYMLFLGNCVPGKGVEVAIQVAKDLNYKLIMCLKIDKGTDIEKYYNNTIKPMLVGTENLITVSGIVTIEKKLELFSKAKVFLMPISWDEPFGLVMLEAMASGTPVVAYNRGSVPEVIANHKSGYIIEANNYEMFRLYTEQTIKSNIVKEYAPKKCLEQAKKFSVDRMVDSYLKVYEEVLR